MIHTRIYLGMHLRGSWYMVAVRTPEGEVRGVSWHKTYVRALRKARRYRGPFYPTVEVRGP